ncbi:MAG: hypothetical protein AAB574_00330 [Patescibacteria group bacterium]
MMIILGISPLFKGRYPDEYRGEGFSPIIKTLFLSFASAFSSPKEDLRTYKGRKYYEI